MSSSGERDAEPGSGADGPLSRLRVPPVRPDPVFRAVLRDHLVAAAARQAAAQGEGVIAPVRPRRGVRVPVLAGAALIAALVLSAHLATCFPMGSDRRSAARTGEGGAHTRTALDREFGERKLGEARRQAGMLVELADQDDTDLVALMTAFRELDGQTRAASEALTRVYGQTGDRTMLTELAAFTSEQRARLRTVASRLPSNSRPRATESLTLICDISHQTRALLGKGD